MDSQASQMGGWDTLLRQFIIIYYIGYVTEILSFLTEVQKANKEWTWHPLLIIFFTKRQN